MTPSWTFSTEGALRLLIYCSTKYAAVIAVPLKTLNLAVQKLIAITEAYLMRVQLEDRTIHKAWQHAFCQVCCQVLRILHTSERPAHWQSIRS